MGTWRDHPFHATQQECLETMPPHEVIHGIIGAT